MGVRVTDREHVALYDSVSGIAFGPVFNSSFDACDFLDWVEENVGLDVRVFAPDEARFAAYVQSWKMARGEE